MADFHFSSIRSIRPLFFQKMLKIVKTRFQQMQHVIEKCETRDFGGMSHVKMKSLYITFMLKNAIQVLLAHGFYL